MSVTFFLRGRDLVGGHAAQQVGTGDLDPHGNLQSIVTRMLAVAGNQHVDKVLFIGETLPNNDPWNLDGVTQRIKRDNPNTAFKVLKRKITGGSKSKVTSPTLGTNRAVDVFIKNIADEERVIVQTWDRYASRGAMEAPVLRDDRLYDDTFAALRDQLL